MSEAGIEKSATLLLALGEEATAAVFRYLSPLDVSRLGQAMRALEVLPRERVREVLREFSREAAGQTGFAADTARFLDDALTRAWPPERAQAMLRRLGAASAQALEKLAWREPAELAGLLESQPPALV
ncbi:MAG: flagellar motor switch protein FliG, partial [Thiobacillus sp.]